MKETHFLVLDLGTGKSFICTQWRTSAVDAYGQAHSHFQVWFKMLTTQGAIAVYRSNFQTLAWGTMIQSQLQYGGISGTKNRNASKPPGGSAIAETIGQNLCWGLAHFYIVGQLCRASRQTAHWDTLWLLPLLIPLFWKRMLCDSLLKSKTGPG